MTMTYEQQTRAYWQYLAADEEWSRIGQAEFGKRWGDVRYTAAGNGELGTALRQVYDAYVEARDAWRAMYVRADAHEAVDGTE
jgi:hypothetical protein